MSYELYLQRLQPPWLSDIWGKLYSGSVGYVLDAARAAALAATRTKFDSYALADTISYRAEDAALCKLPGETDAQLDARISNRWTTWPWCGTAKGVRDMLVDIGFDPDSTEALDLSDGFNGGDNGSNWSGWWIVTETADTHVWGAATGEWGDGKAWGTSESYERVLAVLTVAWKQKSAHSLPITWITVEDGALYWGKPELVWGASSGVWATSDNYRIPMSRRWGQGAAWGVGSWGARPDGVICG